MVNLITHIISYFVNNYKSENWQKVNLFLEKTSMKVMRKGDMQIALMENREY